MIEWRTGALLAVLLGVPLLAFVLPFLAFDDCRCGLSDPQARQLKTEVAHANTIPPLRYQVVAASAPQGEFDAPSGKVLLRGPFGVKVGEAVLADNQGSFERWARREILAWAAAVLIPLASVGLLGWRAWRD